LVNVDDRFVLGQMPEDVFHRTAGTPVPKSLRGRNYARTIPHALETEAVDCDARPIEQSAHRRDGAHEGYIDACGSKPARARDRNLRGASVHIAEVADDNDAHVQLGRNMGVTCTG
jgi:hypothetical protein